MIFAILRAQLQSLRGRGFRRNPGAWLSLIPTLFFYGVFTLAAVGAFALYSYLPNPATLLLALSGGLLGVFLYWQIAPVVTVTSGASLDLQKLIVYPINLDRLFIVEVLLRALTVGEMLLVLAGIGLGIVNNPSTRGSLPLLRILTALSTYAVFNMAVAAGVRSSIERLFQGRRTKEISRLLFVLLCATPGVLAGLHLHYSRMLPYLPLQLGLPWGAAANFVLSPRVSRASGALAILLIWTGLGYYFGRRQFYRVLRADPFAGREPVAPQSNESTWSETFFRLPRRLFRDPIAAMVEKDLRSLSRSSGFRMTFFMGFTFGIVIFVPQVIGSPAEHSFLREHFLAWVSLYSLLLVGAYSFWNAFGYDRGAVQFYFSAPVRFRDVLYAKNICALFAQTLELILITVVFSILPVNFHWLGVLEAFTVTGVACLYLFSMGNLTSVRFPIPMNPDKTSRGSSARGKSAFSMLVLPVAFFPIALAYWGRHVFDSEPVFYLLLLLAAAIGAVIYWISMDSALNLTLTQRERMINTLSRGSGPVSSN